MFHSSYDIEKKGIVYCSRRDAGVDSDAYIRDSLERFCGVSGAVIKRTPDGKPYDADGRCSFSLSHSSKLISIYISSLPSVGCDIQRTDRKYSEKEIAAKAFESDEIEWMERNSVPFFLMWSLKEAFAKADGRGIFLFHQLGSILPNIHLFRSWTISDGPDSYFLSIYPAGNTELILSDTRLQAQQYTLPLSL